MRAVKLSAIFAATLALTSAAGAQVLMEKNVSMAMARAIIDGALEQCKNDGFRVVVIVVDRAGQM